MTGADSAAIDVRLQALRALQAVVVSGRSLDPVLEDATRNVGGVNDPSLIKALVFGVLRNYFSLCALLEVLLRQPLKRKDRDIGLLIMLGLFQLQYHRTPEYAVVSETVNSVLALGKAWAKGLVNAVLREYLRRRQELLIEIHRADSSRFNAPEWLISRLRRDWPQHWQTLLHENNQQAPMVLRVNTGKICLRDYLSMLSQAGIHATRIERHPAAIALTEPCAVGQLPGFDAGLVSVQDAAGQWAAPMLDVQPGDRVLDACAAPGGKTLHILEAQSELSELVALEVDQSRAGKVRQNLQRLRSAYAPVTLKVADAGNQDAWWDGKPFQRILLDAPCSGSGVIRRHPDIQLLREPDDMMALEAHQARLLRGLWETLAAGGELLYCTCSVFKSENDEQIVRFIAETDEAEPLTLQIPYAEPCQAGVQILTGSLRRDGFYYAKLRRRQR